MLKRPRWRLMASVAGVDESRGRRLMAVVVDDGGWSKERRWTRVMVGRSGRVVDHVGRG